MLPSVCAPAQYSGLFAPAAFEHHHSVLVQHKNNTGETKKRNLFTWKPSWSGVCLLHLATFPEALRSGWFTCKCVSTCTTVLFQTLMLSAPPSSRRPFSIPHDSNADVFGRGRGYGLEVRYRECLHVVGQSSRLWRRRFQLHLVAGGHRSNNKTPESKSNPLHNASHVIGMWTKGSHARGEKRRMISVLLRISVPGRESASWISKSSYTLSPNLIIFFSPSAESPCLFAFLMSCQQLL